MRAIEARRRRQDQRVLRVLERGPATGGECCEQSGLLLGGAWSALARLESAGSIVAEDLGDGRRLYRLSEPEAGT